MRYLSREQETQAVRLGEVLHSISLAGVQRHHVSEVWRHHPLKLKPGHLGARGNLNPKHLLSSTCNEGLSAYGAYDATMCYGMS